MRLATHPEMSIWLSAQSLGQSYAYNVPLPLRIEGTLDVEALSLALSDLVAAHSALRTTYGLSDSGDLLARVSDRTDLNLRVRASSKEEAHQELIDEARASFDLESQPQFRARIWRVNDREYFLLLVLHHISSDGESVTVLMQDLAEAYAERRRGRAWTATRPDYPAERGALACHAKPAGASGREEFLRLPRDGAATPFDQGEMITRVLSRQVVEALQQGARHRGVTDFVVYTYLAKCVIRSWLGEDKREGKLLLAFPVSLREPEDASTVGHFVNSVPLELDIPAAGLEEELRDTFVSLLEALDQRETPFFSSVPRDVDNRPVVPDFYIASASRPRLVQMRGCFVEEYPVRLDSARAPLSLLLRDLEDGGVRCVWFYQPDQFSATRVDALADAFVAKSAMLARDFQSEG